MERPKAVEQYTNKAEYLKTLALSRDYYQAAGLNPLFVGGVIAKALPLHAIETAEINPQDKTVTVVIESDVYTSMRKDRTYDDFDIIVNHPDQEHVSRTMESLSKALTQQGLTRHFVSTEAVRYPDWKKRNKLLQMVSGIDVSPTGETHFTFGNLSSAPVNPETMESWNYVFTENGKEVVSLPSFNPAVFGLRYLMRLPVAKHGGLRAKDTIAKTDEVTGKKTSKIHTLMKLREKALQTASEQGVCYDDAAWIDFIVNLQNRTHQDALTRGKAELMNLWWTTLSPISTALVHGAGIFKDAAKLGNKFGG